MQPSHPAEEKASSSQGNIQEVINACDTILQSGRDQSLNSVEWFALSMITNWLPDQLTTLSASALSCGGGNPREWGTNHKSPKFPIIPKPIFQ